MCVSKHIYFTTQYVKSHLLSIMSSQIWPAYWRFRTCPPKTAPFEEETPAMPFAMQRNCRFVDSCLTVLPLTSVEIAQEPSDIVLSYYDADIPPNPMSPILLIV